MNGTPSRVVILGNGIIGLCCALSLRTEGHEVVVVDRHSPGSAQGVASYGNAGVVSPWSCVPQCLPGTWKQVPGWLLDPKGPVRVRWQDLPTVLPWAFRFLANCKTERVSEIADAMDSLMQGNVNAYRQYLSGTGHENLLQDSWYINVYRGAARPNPADLPWVLRQQRGATVEFIGRRELTDMEPAIGPDYHSAAIIRNQARLLSPGRLCEVLADKARQAGVCFINASVRALTPRSDNSITLTLDKEKSHPECVDSAGQLDARRLVLCAGIGSSALLAPLGYRLPLMAERGYHIEFANPGVALDHSIQDMAGKFVASSMQGGIRVAGTAEFARSEAAPDYRRADIFKQLSKRLLPDLNINDTTRWMGVRPSFPDNLPAIGPLKKYPQIIVAFGHSHYGMGMAPATARLVSGMIAENGAYGYASPFKPERFQS